MGSTKTSVSYQGTVALDDAKTILRDLLKSLDEGRVVVRRGGEHVTLTPAPNVELELTGKQKKDRQSLEIEISWRLQAPIESGGAEVLITSEEPVQEFSEDDVLDESAPLEVGAGDDDNLPTGA